MAMLPLLVKEKICVILNVFRFIQWQLINVTLYETDLSAFPVART